MEPTKSILVVAPWNVDRDEDFFRGMVMIVVTGRRYLVGFIGYQDAETMWLDEKVQGWAELVIKLSGVDRKHPQTAYSDIQK